MLAKIYLALKCVKSLDLLGIYIHVCWDCSKLKKSSCITTRDIEEIEIKEKKNFCFTNPTKKAVEETVRLYFGAGFSQYLHLLVLLRTEICRGDSFLSSYPQHFHHCSQTGSNMQMNLGKRQAGKKKKLKRGLVTFFQTIISACVFLFKCVRFYCHIN